MITVLALLRTSVRSDVIGWVQMGPLDLVSKENNHLKLLTFNWSIIVYFSIFVQIQGFLI